MDQYEILRAVCKSGCPLFLFGTKRALKINRFGYLTAPIEKWSTARHQLGFYINVAFTGVYTLPDSYTLPPRDYVYKAIEFLLDWHSILSAIPLGEEGTDPQFVRLPEIDLAKSITFQERRRPVRFDGTYVKKEGMLPSDCVETDPELDDVLEEEHNTKFAAPLPFWRLRVLTESDNPRRLTVVFAWHHALGDGESGTALHRTFLQGLHMAASLTSGEAKQVIQTPRDKPLLPSVEELHATSLWALPSIIATVVLEIFRFNRPQGLWSGPVAYLPLQNRMESFALPRVTGIALREACRRNQTSITATLNAILAKALFDNLPLEYSLLKCRVVLSSRRWMPAEIITEDSLGVFVHSLTESYQRASFDIEGGEQGIAWEESRRTKRSIDYRLWLGGKDISYKPLSFIKNYQERLFLPRVGKSRDLSFEVANLGSFKPPSLHIADTKHEGQPPNTTDEEEKKEVPVVKVSRMTFSQSATVAGQPIGVGVATGPDGCMVLCFGWQDGVFEEQFAYSVIESMKSSLLDLTV